MQEIKIEGTIVGGAKKGRAMGFPTANIVLEPQHHFLENGVYVAEITICGENFKGIANIGVHPTVGSAPQKLLEVNIFNFDRDIYGEKVTVYLHDFLRGDRKFSNIDELIKQITEDKKQVEKIVNL